MKKWFLATATLCLQASQIHADCFNWEGGLRTGYRQDKFWYEVFDAEQPNLVDFKENFDRIRSYQVEAFTKFRFWWLEIGGDADWAWVEGGKVQSTVTVEEFLPNNVTNLIPLSFLSDADGELWDAYGTAAIRVPLYQHNCYFFAIHPLGGYSIHHQSLKRRNTRPESIFLGPFFLSPVTLATDVFVEAVYTNRVKRTLFGPFVGGNFSIGHRFFKTYFGYSYHWLRFEQKFDVTNLFEFFITNVIPEESGTIVFDNFNTFKSSNNRGHRAWLTLSYYLPNCWRVGLRGTYFQVNTSKRNSKNENVMTLQMNNPTSLPTVTVTDTEPAIKANWRTFSILFEAAYEF